MARRTSASSHAARPPDIVVDHRCAEPLRPCRRRARPARRTQRRAAAQLGERGRGGRRFVAALFRSDGHVARLEVETGRPTRDAAVIARLFRERIDAIADPLDPGFGFDLIRLAVPLTEPLAPEQLAARRAARSPTPSSPRCSTGWRRGLGPRRVRRFAAGDSHIPEQAAFELPVAARAGLQPWPVPEPGEPPLRPLHLFDPPQRIEVIAAVPDGPPLRFRWRAARHDVTRAEGPERIAAEWWRRRDGKGLTRDYYRVEDGRGRRFWVFRHGLYGVEKATPDWYLHGVFA